MKNNSEIKANSSDKDTLNSINPKKNTVATLTLFGFFAMTASMVMTVYAYPTFATSGLHLVFFLLLGGFLWFLPVALCSAEMATVDGWEEGGIFSWTGGMLGERFGFAAIFFQWFQITVGFVTMIYFVLGCLSFLFDFPALQNTSWIKFIGVLVVFWVVTIFGMTGTRAAAKLAKFSFMGGVLIPSALLFILGLAFIFGGNTLQITFSAKALLPDFHKLNTLVVFVSFILAYMGVEASASHINEMENPKRNYPLAMILLVFLAIIINTIGGLSVAAVIPADQLNLSSGVVETFKTLITHFDKSLGWISKIIAAMLAFGVIGEISSWVIGPSRGMYAAAQNGLLPPAFAKTNKKGVPVQLIIMQGVVTSIWAAVLTFGGGGNNLSFLTAISLTVVIYLVGYILLFIAYIKLAHHDEKKRTYHVPGGKVGKYIFAFSGLIISIFAIIISFIPPTSISKGQDGAYLAILGVSFLATILIPFIIHAVYGKKHSVSNTKFTHLKHHEQNKYVHLRARGEHTISSSNLNKTTE